MKKFILPEDVRNALIGYFQERPYKEAHQIIPILENLEELKEEEKKDEELEKE